jgi:ABC-type uncharacterized transport system involved in gliding motility auxiliary subunit
MHKTIQISLIAVVAIGALLIASSTLAPAAFAHKKHHHHSSIKIHQSNVQVNSCSDGSNCQNAAVNQANVNSHDNNAIAVNIHDINLSR